MSHYHFNVQNGTSSLDRDWVDVIDFDDARRQALHMAGVMLQEQGLGHFPVSPVSIEVADGNGSVVLSVQVSLTYRSDPERRLRESLSSTLR